MRKNKFLLLVLLAPFLNGQVGINTTVTPSTLTVSGSIQGAYKEISDTSYSLVDEDFYLSYTGTAAATFTLPNLSTLTSKPSGRVYKIKNTTSYSINIAASGSDVIVGAGGNLGDLTSFTLAANNYIEIAAGTRGDDAAWFLSFTGKPEQQNVKIYGTQLTIPPNAKYKTSTSPDFTDHTVEDYDTGDWWVISKVSYAADSVNFKASRMVVTYEYQKTKFDISNLYPILTTGNVKNYPDVLVAVVTGLINTDEEKTRLIVSVARLDAFVDWDGRSFLNVLFAKESN